MSRCAYCRADNLLDAKVVARATARRRSEVVVFDGRGRASARRYGVVTTIAAIGMFLALVAASALAVLIGRVFLPVP